MSEVQYGVQIPKFLDCGKKTKKTNDVDNLDLKTF